MYNKGLRRAKAIISRCLKPFKKQESHEVKEYGNCCCHLQRKTLVTGFPKTDKSKRWRKITIKLFVFFLCTSGFFFQTWSFLQMYLAYPTTQDTSEEYPDSFPVPAVSICNRNRLLRQPYCKAYPELCTWKHTTWETFCEEYSRMCPKTKPPDFSFGIPTFTYDSGQDRSRSFLYALKESEGDLLQYCLMFGFNTSGLCKGTLKYIVVPRNGFPYRCLSMFLRHEGLYEEQLNLTVTDGFYFGLNMHPEEYFNTIDPVEASIVLHDPRKNVNPMTEGIILKAGKRHKVFATMERRESLPPPYASKCFDYLLEWEKNGESGPLSKDDCIKNCTISAMVDKYGCVGQGMSYPNGYRICRYPTDDATSEMVNRCASGCRDACEENIYHLTSDTLINWEVGCNPTDENCKSRELSVLLSFSRMKIKIFKQIPRIESIELLSYIGGYLGIWLGISLTTAFDLAERIYEVIDYVFPERKRNRKTPKPIHQFRSHTVIV